MAKRKSFYPIYIMAFLFTKGVSKVCYADNGLPYVNPTIMTTLRIVLSTHEPLTFSGITKTSFSRYAYNDFKGTSVVPIFIRKILIPKHKDFLIKTREHLNDTFTQTLWDIATQTVNVIKPKVHKDANPILIQNPHKNYAAFLKDAIVGNNVIRSRWNRRLFDVDYSAQPEHWLLIEKTL